MGISYKPIGNLADMDESILMDADIDKGAEGGHICHDTGEFHSHFQIGHCIDTVGEGKKFKLLTGITPRFGKFAHNVIQRRHTDGLSHIIVESYLFSHLGASHQVNDCAAAIPGHSLDDGVTFGMNCRCVEGILPVINAEKSGRLLECLWSHPGHFENIVTCFKGAMLVSEGNNIARKPFRQSRNRAKQFFTGSIYIDTDGIDTTDDHIIERGFQHSLIHVMLILTDTDRFGIDLYQFGQWIRESPSNGNGTTNGDIVVGKFFTCYF